LKYLLDTQFMIAVFRRQPRALQVFAQLAVKDMSMSVISYLEFVKGEVTAGRSDAQTQRTLLAFKYIELLPVTVEIGKFAARESLRLNRTDINDLMIAATARTYRRTVLTENVSDFAQVSGVKTKNWKLEEV
jgi:predicted nucleic acid-binding protein